MKRADTPRGVEAELIPIECAAIMDEIAHAVRHDMNNRLASIRNAADYLRDQTEETDLWTSDSRVPRFFDLIDNAVDNAKALLADRLHVEPLFARRAAHLNATEVVAHASEQFVLPSTIELELELDSQVELFIDRGELMLLTVLLLRNAVEAQPKGGRVRVRLLSANDTSWLEIVDDGPWLVDISPYDAMLPYQTTKAGHLGLGLPIARRIAHRYGGRVELAEPGAPARARITFSGDRYDGFSSLTGRR